MACSDADRLRDRFLGWQCRIRQLAVRDNGGRPLAGMRPRILDASDGSEIAPAVTVIIVEKNSAESTAMFRHIVRRTHDPEKRYKEALEVLTSAYFQHPRNFSDALLAVYPLDSALAERLIGAGRCVLEFEEFGEPFPIACAITDLPPGDDAHQAAYWHNHMFNTAMPGAVRVIAFAPDWRQAAAYPPV